MSTSNPSSHLESVSTRTNASHSGDANFQEGLNKIIKTYESQLGRTLEESEVASVTTQARKFYENNGHQQQVQMINEQGNTTIDASTSVLSSRPTLNHDHQPSLIQTPDNEEGDKPTPYPTNFYELARLISSSSSMGHNNDQLLSILSSQTNLPGLKSIPNKLNDQKPSSSVLAHQVGAGKKPWETQLEESKLERN